MNFDQIAVVKLASEGAAEAIAVGLRLEGFVNPVVACSDKTTKNAGRLSQYLRDGRPTIHHHCWLNSLEAQKVSKFSVLLMACHIRQRKSYHQSNSLVIVVESPEAFVWCIEAIKKNWNGVLEDSLDQAVFTHAQARQVCA